MPERKLEFSPHWTVIYLICLHENMKHVFFQKSYVMLSIFTLSLYKSEVIICTSLEACVLFFRRYRHKVNVGFFIRITLGMLNNLIWEKNQKSDLKGAKTI